MTPASRLAVAFAVVAVAYAAQQRGCVSIVAPAVESPFPATGAYLLIAGESSHLTGIEVAANVEAVRKAAVSRQVLDYSRIETERPSLPEPWQAALVYAKSKSGGKPYYVARNGGKASEGPLEGGVASMASVLTTAVEGLK